MERRKIIFLRHADTEKDSNIKTALWGLSEEGKRQAEKAANLPVMQDVDLIYVSEEKKTVLTAEPLVKKLGKKTKALGFFDEVKRGDKFLTKEKFEVEKIKQLTNLDYHAFGGESGKEALARFKQGIDLVSKKNVDKTILIVTHGTILNIYFADLLDACDLLPERWKKTAFCSYGVTEDGKVVKDIIL